MSDEILDPNPLLDDALILRLIHDLAAGIHTRKTIAQRYGFKDIAGLVKYLTNHPGVVEQIKKARAIITSDEGSESRVKLKALQATEALIPATAGIAADPRVAPQQRIDAFKQLSRVSGMDGSAAAVAASKSFGPAFTLNILFRDNPEKLSFVDAHPSAVTGAASTGAPTPPARSAAKITPDIDEYEDFEDDV
jgi:hypothetical protein